MENKPLFKNMNLKQKIEYIWDYYKIPIFCAIFLFYAIGSTIYNYITEKDCLLKIIMVNGSIPYDGAIFADDFLLAQNLDPDTQEIVVSSVGLTLTEKTYQQDYYTIQALLARLTSGDIDIMSAPADIFKDYAHEGYFMDLNEIFNKDELHSYEELLVFTTDPKTNKTYPCAFDLSNSVWIDKYGYYTVDCYFGILYNSTHTEFAKEFLMYISETPLH